MSEVGKDLIHSANEVLNGEARYIKLKRRDLVYCEDCKYFIDGNGCTLQGADYTWEEQMGAMDYCSRGEKR